MNDQNSRGYEIGKRFGYPDCCIEYFQTSKRDDWETWISYDGYVPCPTHRWLIERMRLYGVDFIPFILGDRKSGAGPIPSCQHAVWRRNGNNSGI